MKPNKLASAIILLILMAAPLSSAALYVNVVTDEFSIESPLQKTTVKSCECGLKTDPFEIINHGDFEALFSVEVHSPIQSQITLSQNNFLLKPGEKRTIHAYVYAPCDTSITSYYILKVSTNYGRSKEIYKDFESKKCQNIKFTTKLLDTQVRPGESSCTEIELENPAEFEETYFIRPTTNLGFAQVSREELTLKSGEKTRVLLCTKLPYSAYGKVDQAFSIQSKSAANSVNGMQSYEILRDYDFAIKTESLGINVCEDVETKTQITMQNIAATPNKYDINLRGPHFASLSNNQLEIEGNTYKGVDLVLKPGELDAGEYDITITAKTTYGDIQKDKNFKLVVDNCFDMSANLNSADVITDKACCGQKEFTLNVANRGKFEETYQIIVDSEGWVSVPKEYEYIRLRPGQQENIKVTANLPCTDSQSTSYVIVKQVRAPYNTKEFKLDLQSMSQRSCHNVELIDQSYDINYETESIPLILQGTGMKGGNYNLTISEAEGNQFELVENNVTINAGELQVLHVKPINLTGAKEGRYLSQISLQLQIEDEKISYDKQFWVQLKDKSFLSKMINSIRNFNYGLIGYCGLFSILLLGILVLLAFGSIHTRTENYKVKRIRADKIKLLKYLNIAIVLAILLLVLVLLFMKSPDESRFYEQSSNKTGPLYHEWKANQAYKIDLTQYYEDPDADSLVFTASQPDHISVSIEGSVATLIPENGWSGTEYIAFTASDSRGGIAHSQAMELHVIKKKPIAWYEYWSIYCRQINLVLLIASLVLLLLITDAIEEKGYKRYLPNKRK